MRDKFRTYLGSMGEGPHKVHVYADLRLVDDLNDHERTVETVEHEQVRYGDVPSIGITWEYGTRRELNAGNGSGGAGIDADILRGLSSPRANRIHELAERWHLNTMRAACAHQQVRYETSPYGPRTSLTLTKPCPATGYRYGSAWLVEVPPAEIIEELRALFTIEEREGSA